MKAVPLLLTVVCLANVAVATREEKAPAPARDQVLVLEPLKVHGSPIISYAIDITIYGEPQSPKENRIFIACVLPDTDAEKGRPPGRRRDRETRWQVREGI